MGNSPEEISIGRVDQGLKVHASIEGWRGGGDPAVGRSVCSMRRTVMQHAAQHCKTEREREERREDQAW